MHVDVQVATELRELPAEPDIQRWLEIVIAELGDKAAALGEDPTREVEVSVRIVDEAESRALNKRYRDRDSATNVLSFPLTEEDFNEPPAELPRVLGDIVICGPVVAREASDQGKRSSDHWAHLLVHGALHLVGYDHETDDGAREMETLEARILAQGGVENPYKIRD